LPSAPSSKAETPDKKPCGELHAKCLTAKTDDRNKKSTRPAVRVPFEHLTGRLEAASTKKTLAASENTLHSVHSSGPASCMFRPDHPSPTASLGGPASGFLFSVHRIGNFFNSRRARFFLDHLFGLSKLRPVSVRARRVSRTSARSKTWTRICLTSCRAGR